MKFEKLESKIVVLPIDNIDTDQIIPARYLKAISMDGLGEGLFIDWRKNPDGTLKPDFPLNKPENHGAQILVTGDNFGCGSSREHAPWALVQNGIRTVVSTSFADIFKGNALKNGLLPVVVPADVHKQLINSPGARVTIDLAAQTLTLAGGPSVHFPIDAFAKRCMLDGVDELGYMLHQEAAIAAFESKHPTLINTLA
jgi:3-isopropylmalate/(R)-2-methylmalate dehydratase small subunit